MCVAPLELHVHLSVNALQTHTVAGMALAGMQPPMISILEHHVHRYKMLHACLPQIYANPDLSVAHLGLVVRSSVHVKQALFVPSSNRLSAMIVVAMLLHPNALLSAHVGVTE